MPNDTPTDETAYITLQYQELNEPQRETIAKLFRLIRFGAQSIDVKVRKDGKETWFEADWIALMARSTKEDSTS